MRARLISLRIINSLNSSIFGTRDMTFVNIKFGTLGIGIGIIVIYKKNGSDGYMG
jgi:hypothetical protein